MSENTWPGGVRRALDQSAHEQWNAGNYPGTQQICVSCDNPTERCVECWKASEEYVLSESDEK